VGSVLVTTNSQCLAVTCLRVIYINMSVRAFVDAMTPSNT
jgi:hypothetical protein